MRTIACVLAACAALALPAAGRAQGWPAKPVHLVVAFAPGGPADIVARLLGQRLTESLGQPIVVENRGGAGGNVGAALVAKAAPDGYTALLTTASFAVNMTLFAEPGYDAERDFEAVSIVAFQPNLIVVNAASPAKTLADLFSEAKGKKLPYASPGTGTSAHLTAEYLFKVLAKVDLFPVHFRGAGPAVAALVAGDPAVGSLGVAGPLAQIKAGKLRALAVSSKKRVPPLPDVPTLAEAGFPGAEFDLWIAVFLPARTPAPVVARMSGAIDDALHAPAIQERLQALAFEPGGGSAADASAYVKAEIAKWRKVVQETGAKPD